MPYRTWIICHHIYMYITRHAHQKKKDTMRYNTIPQAIYVLSNTYEKFLKILTSETGRLAEALENYMYKPL